MWRLDCSFVQWKEGTIQWNGSTIQWNTNTIQWNASRDKISFLSTMPFHSLPNAVKISLHASLLIFGAETTVLVNKVGALLCSTTGFSICSIPKTIFGG